ncbi:MAG: RNA 2'-phosphotransferase [Desulfosudaceae bacterium]
MTTTKANKKLAKLIAYMLGHSPGEFGLVTDSEGFVKTSELLKAINEEEGWGHVRPALLNELRLTLPQVPFEIREELIRANDRQRLPAQTPEKKPPPLLYTCIRRKALAHVNREGISPTHHEKIILAPDKKLAERIGRRRDAEPALLTVSTETALNRDIIFFKADPPLLVTDFIPPDCFTAPSLPKEKAAAAKPVKKSAPDKDKQPGDQAGSFAMKPEAATVAGGKNKKKNEKGPSWKKERKKIRRDKQKGWPDRDQ